MPIDVTTIGIIIAVVVALIVIIIILIKVIGSKGGGIAAYSKSANKDYDTINKLSSHFAEEKEEDLKARRVGLKTAKEVSDIGAAIKSGDSDAIKESIGDAEKLTKYGLKQEKIDLKESKKIQNTLADSIEETKDHLEDLNKYLTVTKTIGHTEGIEFYNKLIELEQKELELKRKLRLYSEKEVKLNKRKKNIEKNRLLALKELPILEFIDNEKASADQIAEAKSKSQELINEINEKFEEEKKRARQEILLGIREEPVIEELKSVAGEKAATAQKHYSMRRRADVKTRTIVNKCLGILSSVTEALKLTKQQRAMLSAYARSGRHEIFDGKTKLTVSKFEELLSEFEKLYDAKLKKEIDENTLELSSREFFEKAKEDLTIDRLGTGVKI